MSCPEDKKIPQSLTSSENTSKLYEQLLEIFPGDNAIAEKYLSYFETDDFKERFGDYTDNKLFDNREFNIQNRTNDIKEPKLFLNENNNRYYFLDKWNEKVYYPFENQGISYYMGANRANHFAKGIAFSYFNENMSFDYDLVEFLKSPDSKDIYSFVKDYLTNKIEELENSDDIDMNFLADTVEELSNNELAVKDLEQLVKNTFANIKIDIQSIQEVENQLLQEEAPVDDIFRQESWLKDSKDNVSNNIKLMLSLVPSNKTNEFGDQTFVPFFDIYTTLNKELAGIEANPGEQLFDKFENKIKELTNDKPYLNYILEEYFSLEDGGMFKEQFTAAFNLTKKDFIQSEIERVRNGIEYSIKNLSSTTSRVNNLISQWQFNLNEYVKEVNKDEKKHGKEVLKKVNTQREAFNKNRDKHNLDNMDSLKFLLREVGITVNEDAFNLFLRGNDYSKTELDLDVVSNTFNAIEYFIKEGKGKLESQSIFKKLAEAQSFFMEETSDASIFSMGKNKWIYSMPSYIDKQLAKWRNDPTILENLYNSGIFYQHSNKMAYLLAYKDQYGNDLKYNEEERLEESKKRLSKVKVVTFNGIQEKGRLQDAVDNKSASKTDLLGDDVNKSLGIKKGSGSISYFKTTLAADKSTDYAINWGADLFFDTKYSFNQSRGHSISEKVVDVVFDNIDGEYLRIGEAKNSKKEIANYNIGNKNAFKIHMMPELSVTIDPDTGDVTLPNTVNDIYDAEGNILFTDGLKKAPESVKKEIKNIIKKSLYEKIESTMDYFISNGVFKYDINGNLQNVAVDTTIFNNYKKEAGKDVFHKIASDYFINNLFNQLEYNKMFTGDLAFYKNPVDYIKRVPASYTDGIYMNNLSQEDQYFNTSVIDSITIPPYNLDKFPKELQEMYSGSKNNTTDAQAWITPGRWKFIKQHLGKWRTIDQSIYDKMTSGKEENYTNQELKRLAQPLKGVHFELENGRPVYLKYSQAVLVPQLIKDSDVLSDLYDKMTKDSDGKTLDYKDQIHELVSIDGVKVGAHKPVNILNSDNSYNFDSKLESIQLSNAHWKLQQDLNPKGIKETLVGSQIQKLIFAGLKNNLNKDFINPKDPSKQIKGSELYDMLHDTMSDLSNIQTQNLLKRLGVDPNTYEIQNEDVLYEQITKELLRRGADQKTIESLKSNLSPYAIMGQVDIFQNIFSSMINDASVRIKTQGGGHIQMADYGISKKEANNRGVRFTPWFNNVDGKLHAPEQYTDENGIKKVRPGGVFISGSMIAKYVPNYRQLSDEKLFGTLNEDTGKYEGGLIDQRILENIVGYRIPNQGLASSDAFIVMGILPETMADTVVAYNGITTKTGSDYDIDKMYLMTPSIRPERNYIEKELKALGISHAMAEGMLLQLGIEDYNQNSPLKTFNEYYETFVEFKETLTPEWQEKIDEANELYKNNPITNLVYEDDFNSYKGKQNLLISAFSSVLANPATIKDVMNPIDIDYMKDDIVNMFPQEDMGNFDLYNVTNQLDTKIEFMLGKAGLGQNVNFLVDFVRGLHSDFKLDLPSLLDFNVVKDKNDLISLDGEYSNELTESEIESYVESYNSKKNDNDKKLTKKEVKDKFNKLKTTDTMTALINAFVDIAKDPYIVRGNWTTQTNPIAFTLIRAGVHPFTVNAFLGQPIIKEYIKYTSLKESNIVDETYDLKNNFIKDKLANQYFTKKASIESDTESFNKRELFKKHVSSYIINQAFNKSKFLNSKGIYTGLKKDEDLNNVKDIVIQDLSEEFVKVAHKASNLNKNFNFDLTQLRDNIDKNDFNSNLTILQKFFELTNDVKEVSKSVNASKNDVNGKGKNITSLLSIKNMTLDLLESKKFINFKDKFGIEKPTFAYNYYQNSIETSQKLMQNNPKFFITANPSVVRTFNLISKLIYGENLQNEKLGDLLEKEYYTYLMSNFKGLKHTGKKHDFLNKVLEDYSSMKEKYPDNSFLAAMEIKTSTFKTPEGFKIPSQAFLTMNNVKKDTEVKNDLNRGFESLYENEKQFASSLIQYSYMVSGFNPSLNSFHQFIPNKFFNENGFNSYIKNTTDILDRMDVDENFINQFLMNNLNSSVITKKLSRNIGKFNKGVLVLKMGQSNKPVVEKNGNKFILTKTDEVNKTLKYTKIDSLNSEHEGVGINIKDYKFLNSSNNKLNIPFTKYLNIDSTNKELKFNELDKYKLQDVSEIIEESENEITLYTLDNKEIKVTPDKILSYETETGPIKYIENDKGEMIMLKDSQTQEESIGEQLDSFKNNDLNNINNKPC